MNMRKRPPLVWEEAGPDFHASATNSERTKTVRFRIKPYLGDYLLIAGPDIEASGTLTECKARAEALRPD